MREKYVSGSTLKIIAVISMLIDHVGAGILGRVIMAGGLGYDYAALVKVYRLMRGVGRIAFPIYCFLLVEGFMHTRDVKKYAMRLAIFSIISEIPFDLAFWSRLSYPGHQNVFFTLFLGLCAMSGMEYAKEHVQNQVACIIAQIAVCAVCMGAASFLATDYEAIGVFCIIIFYLYRYNRLMQVVAGCVVFCTWELPALVAFIPIYFYNGKRGLNIKYFFYAFYPVHLLLVYLVAVYIGLGQYTSP
jgi:hypothetical protein